jgi:carbonic anhydrase
LHRLQHHTNSCNSNLNELGMRLTAAVFVAACGAAQGCGHESLLRGEELLRRNLLDYNGSLHGQDWAKLYPGCAGNQQSPVNLPSLSTVISKGQPINLRSGLTPNNLSSLEALSPDWPAGAAIAVNNGYSVQVVSTGSGVNRTTGSNHLAYAADRSISSAGESYTLEHVHFHWNNASESGGSEHLVEGVAYDMEAHFYHYNTKYGSVINAKQFQDGLFVIGLLFKLSASNNNGLLPITNVLPSLTSPTVNMTINVSMIDILAPGTDLSKYVAYGGSITTPGCYQTATFAVLDQVAPISAQQLAAFRAMPLAGSAGHNTRAVQPANGRRFFSTQSVWTAPDPSPNFALGVRASLTVLAAALASLVL